MGAEFASTTCVRDSRSNESISRLLLSSSCLSCMELYRWEQRWRFIRQGDLLDSLKLLVYAAFSCSCMRPQDAISRSTSIPLSPSFFSDSIRVCTTCRYDIPKLLTLTYVCVCLCGWMGVCVQYVDLPLVLKESHHNDIFRVHPPVSCSESWRILNLIHR